MVATSHDDNETGNGRVTLALVKREQEITNKMLGESIQEQRTFNRSIEERLRHLEQGAERRDQQIANNCQDINRVEGKVNAWSWGNSAGVTLALILGYLGFNR